MLRAVGFSDEDFKKPIVGIASTWSMVTPCNMHIDELAREAGRGVDEASGKSIIFGTITVSDGISMGTPGMRYSLVSREVIADSIETVTGAEGFDGMVAIEGGFQTKSGEIFNDFPDRVSDPIILICAGYAIQTVPGGVELGWLAGILAVMTAYTRTLAGASGAPQRFLGPMAKQHRMALLSAALVLAAAVSPC